jgi:hypothetical protein
MSQGQAAYVTEPVWSDVQRGVHAAREVLERQERQQVVAIAVISGTGNGMPVGCVCVRDGTTCPNAVIGLRIS